MIRARASSFVVTKQMAHSDLAMIAEVFGRWTPSDVDAAGSKALAQCEEQANGKKPPSG